MWGDASIAEAIEVASPFLARRVQKLCDGSPQTPRQVRRMAMSVARYLLRTTSRATPFGLFSGVIPVGFGRRLTVGWGGDHRAVARADASWLAEVVSDLEACIELLQRLPVVMNNLCFVRGGRLVVPCQQQPPGASGRAAPAEVSVRHTRVVGERSTASTLEKGRPVGRRQHPLLGALLVWCGLGRERSLRGLGQVRSGLGAVPFALGCLDAGTYHWSTAA
ncbi:lantibiotic dehydratase [Streptomyces gobiensis]|uniref:lantibiotic dehydratase n=1 Tax=Streptomyces gobiensis TaxID=2875706 RepID=UPI003BAE23F5|nr:lantibiotic dehydratase family protein [Streptomyces gobiensis]